MEIEVAHKTGAEKGIYAETRTGYRCGYRIRRFDTIFVNPIYYFM